MFVIVRHGNTIKSGESPRRIGARTDPDLTNEGVRQAETLGRYFHKNNLRFDRVLTSPLKRTLQTAEAILANQDHPPIPIATEFLREIDYGCDENRPEDEVRARIGKVALEAWERYATVPTGWNVDPENRIAAWRHLFAESQPDGHVTLLVTSNGSARFALLADPNMAKAAESLASLKLATGSFGIIAREADGRLQLEKWGVRP